MTIDKVTIIKKDNKVTVATAGVQGPRGSLIYSGSGLPSNSLGIVGDYYINTDNPETLYGPKGQTTWPSTGVVIKGVQGDKGVQGYSVFADTTNPADTLGLDGDVFIQSTANKIYNKVNGHWTNAQQIITQAAFSYSYEQQSNSTTWVINHNLGYKPSVAIMDYGNNNIEGDIVHNSVNRLTITFTSSISGYAYLT
jgi:hypothetical protein